MTFTTRIRGDLTKPIVAEYTCPIHGVFACLVQRDANGDAPDAVACPENIGFVVPGEGLAFKEVVPGGVALKYKGEPPQSVECGKPSTWTPSLVAGRVKRFEVVRGGWSKPERSTYLDTRKLGEGQSVEEFKAERKKVWEEKRRQETKELLR